MLVYYYLPLFSDLLITENPVGFSNFDGGSGQTIDILWRHAFPANFISG